MAIVIIIIIVLFGAMLFFKSESEDNAKALLNEKSKIENFHSLIILLKASEPGYVLATLGKSKILKKTIDNKMYKMYSIGSYEGQIHISIILNGIKYKYKNFSFSIYDDIKTIGEYVISEVYGFERTILEQEPSFWGNSR